MNNNKNANQDNNRQRQSVKRVPVYKYRSRRKKIIWPLIAAIILSIAVLVAFIAVIGEITGKFDIADLFNKPAVSDTTGTEPPDTEPAGSGTDTEGPAVTTSEATDTNTPDTSVSGITYKFTEFGADDIGEGDLILINSSYECKFRSTDLLSIYSYKTRTYYLKDSSVQLRGNAIDAINDMMDDFYSEVINVTLPADYRLAIWDAYRSFTAQETLYNNAASKDHVALPGQSDYHSGVSFSMRISSDNGILTIDKANAADTWLKENSYKYGIVFRYPPDKASVTGNDFEPYHFRYVGIPHATVMHNENLCLEEYLDYVTNFPYTGKHISVIDQSGVNYEIFYVSGLTDGNTKVPVPDGYDYTVSGDNISGFIVTVTLK